MQVRVAEVLRKRHATVFGTIYAGNTTSSLDDAARDDT